MSETVSAPKSFGLYGEFAGGPVIGCRVVKYSGLHNDQEVVMVDHPCDPGLMAWMTSDELEEQMLRASTAEYFPKGLPDGYKPPQSCDKGNCDFCAG